MTIECPESRTAPVKLSLGPCTASLLDELIRMAGCGDTHASIVAKLIVAEAARMDVQQTHAFKDAIQREIERRT